MASITSLSNSNYVSSLYNSSNIISGLASGMDTESMIENLTKAYQTKITKLQQKSTKIEWKQDAYRSIISKMYAFSNKYTSYTSSTNLLSPSFFSSAKTSVAQGENASKVSASGTSTSEIELNSVKQLAAAARYSTKSNLKAGDGETISASGAIDLEGTTPVSALQGSLNLTYGTKTVSLYFSDSDIIEPQTVKNADGTTRTETNAEALARVIQDKLKDEEIVMNTGSVSAAERIDVSVDANTGEISFKEKGNAGNSVYISSASDGLKSWLRLPSLENASENKPASFTIPNATNTDKDNAAKYFQKEIDNIDTISGKTFNINLDGTTKQVNGPLITKDSNGDYLVGGTVDEKGNRKDYTRVAVNGLTDSQRRDKLNETYVSELNKALNKEFGNKVTVKNVSGNMGSTDDSVKERLQLQFEVPKDSDILINTDAGDALKIGKTASNYLSTGKSLGDLLQDGTLDNLTPNEDGKYDFVINGTKIGSYDKDTALSKIMSDINSSDAGVKVTYSKTSREFVFTTKDTGSHTEIDMGPGLASAMFGRDAGAVDTTQKLEDVLGDETVMGKMFSFKVDGEEVRFSADYDTNINTLDDVLTTLNDKLGGLGGSYKASFANDGSLLIKNQDGKAVSVSFGDDDEIAKKLMDKVHEGQKLQTGDGADYSYTKGQDAEFTVTVNGTVKTMTRANNKVEIDGMTINFKGTFNEEATQKIQDLGENRTQSDMKNILKSDAPDSVSFQEDVQADQVVDAVKNMIAEYNVMVAEIRSQYATMPIQSSNGSIQEYDPLTDEDRASMSESAIQNYEEKAKQGLLFADSNLSSLYQSLVNNFNRSGVDATTMKNMGIGISYDTNGAATITFDESKFRTALEDDYDGVVDLFTRSSSDGGTDGIMQSMKATLDRYGSTTGAVKGILVQQSGTPLASLSLLDNGWQNEIDNISDQITKIQEKLKSQVDRYTQQFARMETLINQMNQQSSQLASMMGG